jgi:hypothetical protein
MRTMHLYQHRRTRRHKQVLGSWFLVLGLIFLVACGTARPATPAAERPTAPPATPARPRHTDAASATNSAAPQRAPKPADPPTLGAKLAAAPTFAPPSPTAAPIRAVVATHTPAPIQAATVTPAQPTVLRFRAADPEDHYVAIREQPTTKSREVGRLAPGDEIVCAEIVAGETLSYLGQQSNRWAVCPSVGGAIFLPLLIPIRDAT